MVYSVISQGRQMRHGLFIMCLGDGRFEFSSLLKVKVGRNR